MMVATKRVDDGFGLDGEPRPKSYVDVLVGTPRVVSHVDGGRFGLEGEIVRASSKSPLCGGSSECRDDCATMNTSTAHKRCIGQDKARGDDGYLSKAATARSY